MKMISKLLFVFLFVTSTSIYAANWEDLDAKSAKATFSDVTLVHKNFKTYLASDGSSIGEWGKKTHYGKFFINDEGHYCETWDEEGKRDVGCWSLKKKKQKLKLDPASGRADKEYTVKIKEGYNLSNALAMSTEEVIKLISGMTVHGTNTKGKKYRMYFAENGSLAAGNTSKSTGKWEVKDGAVCNTWDDRGFVGCDAVFKSKGKIIYKVPSGKKGKFRKFEVGNQL
jgi:hypothetical protein